MRSLFVSSCSLESTSNSKIIAPFITTSHNNTLETCGKQGQKSNGDWNLHSLYATAVSNDGARHFWIISQDMSSYLSYLRIQQLDLYVEYTFFRSRCIHKYPMTACRKQPEERNIVVEISCKQIANFLHIHDFFEKFSPQFQRMCGRNFVSTNFIPNGGCLSTCRMDGLKNFLLAYTQNAWRLVEWIRD